MAGAGRVEVPVGLLPKLARLARAEMAAGGGAGTAAAKGGRYIFHSDHSVPDNVSFQQYCRVMELVAEHGKF
jgi:hypothetical protein